MPHGPQGNEFQAPQLEHTYTLRTLGESTQEITSEHIFASIPAFDSTNMDHCLIDRNVRVCFFAERL